MVNKDFCLSSYIAFRYIWKDSVDFAEGGQHKNFCHVEDKNRIPVKTSEDIDREIQKLFDEQYAIKYPELQIPFKIPMLRPVDSIFRDWEGPKRGQFLEYISHGRINRKSEMATMVR